MCVIYICIYIYIYISFREDNIRIGLEEIGFNAGNWVDSAKDGDYLRAHVNSALNLRVP